MKMHSVTVNTTGQFSKRDSMWGSNQGSPRTRLSDDLAGSSDIGSERNGRATEPSGKAP